nr:septal ring lytic transglycosylase RlpA family protein [uncultured Holophaga sp.]
MNLQDFVGENWNRAFSVWIEGIQVQFQPSVGIRPGNGGLLARARSFTKLGAVLVLPFFCLYCSRPDATVSASRPRTEVPVTQGRTAPPPALVYTESGMASWYGGQGDGFLGQVTASGEPLDPAALTCAHRTLPFNTLIEVENMDTGKRVILRVNDRGPYIRGRVLDVTLEGARQLGLLAAGSGRVVFHEVTPKLAELADAPEVEDPLDQASGSGFLERTLELVMGSSDYQRSVGADGRRMKRVHAGAFHPLSESGRMPDVPFCPSSKNEPFIYRRT